MFGNNFGKCKPIFKIFSPVIRKKILYHSFIHYTSLTLTAPHQSVDMFLTPENTLRT